MGNTMESNKLLRVSGSGEGFFGNVPGLFSNNTY